MKLTPEEHAAALAKLGSNGCPDQYRLPFRNIVTSGYNLATIDDVKLRQIVRYLPTSGGLINRTSYRVGKKIRQTMLHRARPHLDPAVWPKVFRKINNNSRAGLKDFGGGQLGVLNDKARSVPLTGTFSWNEKEFGELIIMGPWSDISNALGKAGSGALLQVNFEDIYKGDVNVEFDRMYTDQKLPKDDLELVVTYIPGISFMPTDEEGRVVADPRGEIVKTVGGKVAGVAGGGTNFEGAIEIVSASVDTLGLALDMKDKFGVKLRTDRTLKDKYTFVVSIYKIGQDYKYKQTGVKSLSAGEFLKVCKSLAEIS